MPEHREVAFSQNLYAGESSKDWDEVKSTQVFSFHGNCIAQKVQVNPTNNPGNEVEPDRLNMWANDWGQGGVMNSKSIQPSFGGRASLNQKGNMHADYDFAKQWTNINGGAGSSIESWNNQNWVHFNQQITFYK